MLRLLCELFSVMLSLCILSLVLFYRSQVTRHGKAYTRQFKRLQWHHLWHSLISFCGNLIIYRGAAEFQQNQVQRWTELFLLQLKVSTSREQYCTSLHSNSQKKWKINFQVGVLRVWLPKSQIKEKISLLFCTEFRQKRRRFFWLIFVKK